MHRFVKLLFICICIGALSGCGVSKSDKFEPDVHESAAPTPAIEEATADPVYLELRFGDGTVLRKEIFFISIPDDWVSSHGWITFTHYWSENFDKIDGELDTRQNLSYQSTVTFHDGRVLSFTDAYSLEVDMEGRTIIANLWRDTPYETEKAYFEVFAE